MLGGSGLGLHRRRIGRVGVNPVLKKGVKNAYPRESEVIYNHMRLGEAID